MGKQKFDLAGAAKGAIEQYCKRHELTQEAFGKLCGGVTQGAVWQWMQEGVTAERAKEIELATKGEISRADLRPDLFEQAA